MSRNKIMLAVVFFISFFSLNSAHAIPVDINAADAQTLAESLNGIGIKKAQAIVEFREANGNFKTVQELKLVKGIGERTVIRNQDDLALNSTDLAKRMKNQTTKDSDAKTSELAKSKNVMAKK